MRHAVFHPVLSFAHTSCTHCTAAQVDYAMNTIRMKIDRRPTLEDLRKGLAIPLHSTYNNVGAWVEHAIAPRDGPASVLLRECLNVPESTLLWDVLDTTKVPSKDHSTIIDIAASLLQFGAVYTCPIPPHAPESYRNCASSADLERIKLYREAAQAGRQNDTRLSSPRRLTTDELIPAHSYLRVHFTPKRFPAFHHIDWPSRIIAHGHDYVVLDKPYGIPSCHTKDNILESALTGAALGIGANGDPTAQLSITTRLDQVTEGVLVLGKTAEFVKLFTKSCVKGSPEATTKTYRALSATCPPLGHMVHYVALRQRIPAAPDFSLVLSNQPSAEVETEPVHEESHHDDGCSRKDRHQVQDTKKRASSTRKRCELIVHDARRIRLNDLAREKFGIGDELAWESLIELVTGRTHQIRAQLSAVGAPLLGDSLYAPLSDGVLRDKLQQGDASVVGFDPETGVRLLAEPDGAIGLQACSLKVANGAVFGAKQERPVEFRAGRPWWWCDEEGL